MNELSIVICKIVRNTAPRPTKSSGVYNIFLSFKKVRQYITQPSTVTKNSNAQTKILRQNIERLGAA